MSGCAEIIKVDLDVLGKQIYFCDTSAINASTEEERDLFDGLANMISEIHFAITNGKHIEFEGVAADD